MGQLTTRIRTGFGIAVALLFAKVLVSILYEYRWYFPPDFGNSSFLIGRRDSFIGLYPAAFYVHIISGPAALVLGTFQVVSGRYSGSRRMHRRLGGIQTVVVIIVAISGLILARDAFSGLLAAWGFAFLSLATALLLAVMDIQNPEWLISLRFQNRWDQIRCDCRLYPSDHPITFGDA